MKLRDAGVITDQKQIDVNVVLVGCGGLRVRPKCAFGVEMEVYGCKMFVPTLVVPGQHDQNQNQNQKQVYCQRMFSQTNEEFFFGGRCNIWT